MRIFIFTILFFSSYKTYSEIRLRNNSLNNPEQKIICRHVHNHFEIIGKIGREFEIITKKSEIYVSENGNKFEVYTSSTGYDTILIYLKQKLVYKAFFKIEEVGDINCRLGEISSNKTSVKEILRKPYLTLFSTNSIWKVPYTITSFVVSKIVVNDSIPLYDTAKVKLADTMYVENVNGAIEVVTNEYSGAVEHNYANHLTPDQIIAISKLHSGDKLYFYDIKIVSPDSTPRILEPYVLQIE